MREQVTIDTSPGIVSQTWFDHEQQRVRNGDSPCAYYGSTPTEYDREFERINAIPIGERLATASKRYGTAYAMDVMGTTDFSIAAEVDGQVLLTLHDWRDEQAREADIAQQRFVIAGSVHIDEPWENGRKQLQAVDSTVSGFDVVTCRPLLGWSGLIGLTTPAEEKNKTVHGVLQQMASSLRPGGVMLAQLPFAGNYHNWFGEVEDMSGSAVRFGKFESRRGYHRDLLELQRTTEAELVLPPINQVLKYPKPRIRI